MDWGCTGGAILPLLAASGGLQWLGVETLHQGGSGGDGDLLQGVDSPKKHLVHLVI